MSVLAYDKDTRRFVKSSDLQLVNKIIQAKKNNHPWDVVDLLVEVFKKREPVKYKSYIVRLNAVRQAQKKTWVGRKEFRGVSKDKVNDAYLAHTVDFPEWIMYALRRVYNVDELIMDKEFFREFGKRYPEFRIMEVV